MKRILTTLSQKWPEYLLEIIVLIIGIYGAFALENWRDDRNELKKERKYLESLLIDLKEQSNVIEEQVLYENSVRTVCYYILENSIEELLKSDPDTLVSLISSLRTRMTFTSFDRTFEDLKTTGNLRVISNDAIKNEIITYYHQLKRIEKIIFTNNEKFVDDKYNMILLEKSLIIIPREGGRFIDNELSDTYNVPKSEQKLSALALSNMATLENQLLITNLVKTRNTPIGIHLNYLDQQKKHTVELARLIEMELSKP